ncbi:hypothetical protein [Bdellovibrio sp. HCB337]|uniref:hypothetical protein n=1 Tax=Bdellovibrio sp. HCB337 TaxID=3394358 RepID=UPI0039A5160F
MKWRILMLATGFVLGACTKADTFRTEHPQEVKIDDLPTDFKIPADIWTLVEKTGDGKEHEETGNAGVSYSSVKIYLKEKNPEILQSSSYTIELPRGGGKIDLSDYTSGKLGTFYVGFELPPEFQEGTNFKAIYISQGRKRKIDDRVFGAGCNQYFEITPKFLEMMKTEGIKANTTRQRHVTVLAGHYIFSVMKDNRIYITQATITDSKNKNLLCEAL